MGRPKLYEDAAARQAAYRARKSRFDFVPDDGIGEKVEEIAGVLDMSKNKLLNAMIKFALTNHNWKTQGARWAKK